MNNMNKYQTRQEVRFQGPMETSPAKVFSNLRSALNVLSVKSKADRLNSLCVIHTKNKDFHFFHSTNNYIFIELAEFSIAFFYFYKQSFDNVAEASTKIGYRVSGFQSILFILSRHGVRPKVGTVCVSSARQNLCGGSGWSLFLPPPMILNDFKYKI